MAVIQRIIVPDIRKPVSHFCHVTKAGPHVWVAGIVGEAPDGSIPADVVAQFDLAIATMDKCLKAAGAGPEHVVKVQVFMTDITERPKINPRRVAYFGHHLPVSTLVEVKGLVDPRMKVERLNVRRMSVDRSGHSANGLRGGIRSDASAMN